MLIAISFFGAPAIPRVAIDLVDAMRRCPLDADRCHPELRLIARDDLGCGKRMVGRVGRCKGMLQFSF